MIAIPVAALTLAACGSTVVPPTAPPPTATPTASATATPTTTPAGTGVAGGYGDTSNNPDSSYACGYQAYADDGVTQIADLTVAGNNNTDTQALCSSLSSNSAYKSVNTMNVANATPGCYLTTGDGGATARIYTASGGSESTTHTLCQAMLQAAGLPG